VTRKSAARGTAGTLALWTGTLWYLLTWSKSDWVELQPENDFCVLHLDLWSFKVKKVMGQIKGVLTHSGLRSERIRIARGIFSGRQEENLY